MRLHREMDELNLRADILLEQDQRNYADLVDKVPGYDLGLDSDELEQTADVLMAEERRRKNEIGLQAAATQKGRLQRRLALLERVLERSMKRA